ncbi:insulinase family protein [bacterium]|jgi:predicted Zn-dependent peptidase|nr:insulinase family protein [bacterium]MBT4121472.1 insulinase family protein [bacterium]MBT4335282.1 insulinase family protein [bacterium]MBT4495144.1 insulinase family protein [bacterium]MBT4764384.1 insulinase family protein [bacterium]
MYKIETLNNGIKLLTAPLKDTKSVTVLVLVKVGSRNEEKDINGISHFIEHLLFKGTKKRPTSLDITKELDGVGADYNAFTGKDQTGYYVKVAADKIELAFDIVSDMLLNSSFKSKEIDKERGVIIEEINMYDDNPLLSIDNLFEKIVFKGHSLERDIAGPKKNIRKITRKEILNYYNKYYISSNVVVGVGGKFNKQRVNKLTNKYFKEFKKKKNNLKIDKFVSKQNKLRVNLKYKNTEQVQVALGFPAYKINDPKTYPLLLLSMILGGNMSSRLFMEIREKRGLAYSIRTALEAHEDIGAFVVFAGLDKSKIELALTTINNELKKVVDSKVTSDELTRAKDFIRGKLILKLEDSSNLIQYLATQRLFKNKVDTLEEQLKKIDKVTINQIQGVAKEIINLNKLNLSVIGPFKDKNIFFKYLKK